MAARIPTRASGSRLRPVRSSGALWTAPCATPAHWPLGRPEEAVAQLSGIIQVRSGSPCNEQSIEDQVDDDNTDSKGDLNPTGQATWVDDRNQVFLNEPSGITSLAGGNPQPVFKRRQRTNPTRKLDERAFSAVVHAPASSFFQARAPTSLSRSSALVIRMVGLPTPTSFGST
jgi:hypothetical protein